MAGAGAGMTGVGIHSWVSLTTFPVTVEGHWP